ncbi:MAG: signal recognition particle protein [Gammaproteobacteria bacterium]|nr:signal recognition particle protein [Gammaproteobacteria bacterium]NNF61759.1 signal recognition particle protein [Gammaproteobacteria bacterium]NNM20424.1 signal recognition particle protein [Gammaproteobacteria bacterium]
MFDSLSERLSSTVASLRGGGKLTEDNIRDTLRQVRMALLEADVALPVVREFIGGVRERAVGEEVLKSLTPGQALIRVVHEELVHVMGDAAAGLDLRTQPPAVIMVAGLQGSGKTTTVAKLALWLQQREKKKVLIASADVYRPAAILQLQTLAQSIGSEFMPSSEEDDPRDIARRAVAEGRRQLVDVVLLDTAGRLHIDEQMMQEVREVHAAAEPVETLFVLDSMAGQDAVNSARAFDEALPLTGIVLTKTDGDARGGAALSARQVTGKPIKFLGTGEKTDALELFHPDRVASRILGMGDVLTLVEQVQEKADQKKTEKLARKLKKGKGFNLEDLRDQLEQMLGMGGIGGLLDKLPGMGQVPEAVRQQADDRQIRRQIALINSMTPGERRHPKILNGSRKRRIAAGAGLAVQDVNRLVKQHHQMQKMMKKVSRGGAKGLMRAMQGRRPPPF